MGQRHVLVSSRPGVLLPWVEKGMYQQTSVVDPDPYPDRDPNWIHTGENSIKKRKKVKG